MWTPVLQSKPRKECISAVVERPISPTQLFTLITSRNTEEKSRTCLQAEVGEVEAGLGRTESRPDPDPSQVTRKSRT